MTNILEQGIILIFNLKLRKPPVFRDKIKSLKILLWEYKNLVRALKTEDIHQANINRRKGLNFNQQAHLFINHKCVLNQLMLWDKAVNLALKFNSRLSIMGSLNCKINQLTIRKWTDLWFKDRLSWMSPGTL